MNEAVRPAVLVAVVFGDFLDLVHIEAVAEEFVGGKHVELVNGLFFEAVEVLNECFWGDVLVAVERADVDGELVVGVVFAVFVHPEEFGILPAMDDGVFGVVGFPGALRDFGVGIFESGFFAGWDVRPGAFFVFD